MKHVEGERGDVQRRTLCSTPPGMRQMSPGPSTRVTPPIVNSSRPFEQDPHLLVRMRMLGDDGMGLEADDREHQVLPGGRPNLDARKDHVP